MKLGLKIILPILLLLVIVTGAFAYILYNLKQQETVLSTEGAKIRTLNGLNERLARDQEQTDYNVLAYRFNQDRSFLLAISQAALDKSKILDEMYPSITSVRGRELINSYIDSRKAVESLRNELIKAIDDGDQEQIALNYNKWSIQTQNIKAALTDIGAYNINSLEKTLVAVGDIRNKISEIIIILVFVVIATVLFLFFYLRIVITTPIIKLAQFADEISRQNFTTTTTTTTRKDELGMLSRAFNTMVVKLKESYATLEQKIVERTAKLAEKTREAENAQRAALNVLEDLKIKEQTLIEAKVKDEAMLLSIGDGVIVTDQDGVVVVINKGAEDILGLTGKEIIGKLFIQAVSQEDAQGNKIPDNLRPITLALNSGTVTINHTYNFVRKDGIKIPVAITVTPVILDSEILGAVLVFRDITKEKDIDKAKTEFVSLASHQLRTPLTDVSWHTEMILRGDLGAVIPKQKKYLEAIYQGNKRMIDLVNTLLDVSRLELGTFKVEPTQTDIIALAQSVLDEQKSEIEKKKIIITKNFNKDIPTFSTDPKLLRMVFQNLLANAVAYTAEDGKIELFLSLDNEKKGVLFKVSDTGYGIPKNQQAHIFTKFFRADNVRDKDTDGTGLGLYIVKSIVENSGGKIWFESEENNGTTFYVTLPMDGMKEKEGSTQLS